MLQLLRYLKPVKNILTPIYYKLSSRNQISAFKHTRDVPSRFILIGSPEHGNLGDYAISEAELTFFHDNFPKIPIIELSGPCYRNLSSFVSPHVKESDIIFVTGGGFLGSLWMVEEEMVRDIIQRFPNNHIIILPQTIYFEKSEKGRAEYLRSREIYGNHTKLTICLREKLSYDFVLNNLDFSNGMQALLVSDMVLYIDNDSDCNLSYLFHCPGKMYS